MSSTRFRMRPPLIKHPVPVTLAITMLVVAVGDLTLGSEFPERECCDSVYPLPPPSGPLPHGGHHDHGGMDHPYPEAPNTVHSTPPSTTTTQSTGNCNKVISTLKYFFLYFLFSIYLCCIYFFGLVCSVSSSIFERMELLCGCVCLLSLRATWLVSPIHETPVVFLSPEEVVFGESW